MTAGSGGSRENGGAATPGPPGWPPRQRGRGCQRGCGADRNAAAFSGETVRDHPVPRPADGGQHARPVPLSAAGAHAYQMAQPHQSRLWQPEAHPVLFRKRMSLEASGLAGSAITYWQTMLITSTRLPGNAHANAVAARDRLGAQGCHRALQAAGRGYRGGGRPRSSRRDRGTDHPRVGLWSQREAEGRDRALPAGAGRPRAHRRGRSSGHDRGPGQPGLRLPQRRATGIAGT